jgi:hypothetical protein
MRAQLRDEWATLAAIGTGELLSRIEGMDTRTLVATAGISADKLLLLEGTTTATAEPTAQSAADAWAEFVARCKVQNPQRGQ